MYGTEWLDKDSGMVQGPKPFLVHLNAFPITQVPSCRRTGPLVLPKSQNQSILRLLWPSTMALWTRQRFEGEPREYSINRIVTCVE